MNEETIQKLILKDNYTDLLVEIAQMYPNGFKISDLDKRIQDRLQNLQNKYYDIQKPI